MTLAKDGRKAVDAIVHGAPGAAFDLVLMDLHMPELDGYGAAQQIRQWEADSSQVRLPIVALTADAFEEDRQRCLAVGMDDFVTKPISLPALTAALAKWLPMKPAAAALVRALDEAAFAALVQQIVPLLEQNKFSAIAQFERLRERVHGTWLAADIEALDSPLQALNFGLVCERLQAAVRMLENRNKNQGP